jgi:hypothetical protein
MFHKQLVCTLHSNIIWQHESSIKYFRVLKTVAILNIVRVRHFLRDRSSHETTRATFCCSPVPQSSRKLCNSTTPSLLKTLHSERPGIRSAFLSTSSFFSNIFFAAFESFQLQFRAKFFLCLVQEDKNTRKWR